MLINNEPSFGSDGFNCPCCGAYAHQEWYDSIEARKHHPSGGTMNRPGFVKNLFLSYCSRCNGYSLWVDEKMIYPNSSIAPLPIEDMPKDVKEDFLEARNIVNESPRGAGALLRLALQKLMPHIGGKGKNLNEDIKILVENGLPVKLQKALDSLRVIGNEAVHPGQIDLRDNPEIVQSLFKLLNLVVDVMIIQPKEIEQLYGGLPDDKKAGIKDRDKSSLNPLEII